jgi:hypothetical protein
MIVGYTVSLLVVGHMSICMRMSCNTQGQLENQELPRYNSTDEQSYNEGMEIDSQLTGRGSTGHSGRTDGLSWLRIRIMMNNAYCMLLWHVMYTNTRQIYSTISSHVSNMLPHHPIHSVLVFLFVFSYAECSTTNIPGWSSAATHQTRHWRALLVPQGASHWYRQWAWGSVECLPLKSHNMDIQWLHKTVSQHLSWLSRRALREHAAWSRFRRSSVICTV